MEFKNIYITGDTHGDFYRVIWFEQRVELEKDSLMIVLGDAGLNYYCDERDNRKKEFLKKNSGLIYFCIHGNHEQRPYLIPSYKTKEFCGGTVYYEPKYPNILFAKDGEVYDLNGTKCFVIGGAYSIDKAYRLKHGGDAKWYSSEQPDDEIKSCVETKIAELGNKVDVVLTHTCPLKYEPTEVFLPWVDQSGVDKSTEEWLDRIEESLDYKKWYCGHYHTVKKIDKLQFMFEDYDVLPTPSELENI